MTITLYIIRHGATKSNKRHAYLGNTNEPLSNEGGEQIIFYNEAGRYPKEKDNLLIFSRPMLRCLQTKDILYPDTRAILLPEWKEIDFGRFEGCLLYTSAARQPYGEWLDSNMVQLRDLKIPNVRVPEFTREEMLRLMKNFGYTFEQLRSIVLPMAKTGTEPTAAMGHDTQMCIRDSIIVLDSCLW